MEGLNWRKRKSIFERKTTSFLNFIHFLFIFLLGCIISKWFLNGIDNTSSQKENLTTMFHTLLFHGHENIPWNRLMKKCAFFLLSSSFITPQKSGGNEKIQTNKSLFSRTRKKKKHFSSSIRVLRTLRIPYSLALSNRTYEIMRVCMLSYIHRGVCVRL